MVRPHHRLRRASAAGLLLVALAVAGGVLLSRGAPSGAGPVCTRSWASAVDGSWADPARWSPAGVPTAADDMCITASGTYTVTLTGSRAANSIQVGSSGAGLATLAVEGVGCSASAQLDVTGTAEVFGRGRLDLTSSGCGAVQSVVQTGGGLTNDGSVRTVAGVGGTRYLRGDVLNRGSVSIGAPTEFDTAGTTWDNQGPVAVDAALAVRGGPTFIARSGTIASSGAGALTVSGASFEQRGGSTTGAAIVLLNATFSSTGAGGASFVAHQSATVSGTIGASQSLRVEAVACSYNTQVDVTGNLTNAGSLTLTTTGCGGAYALLQGPGLLTNTTTGTISSTAGTGGERYLRMSVRNQGSVVVSQPTAFDLAGTEFDNRGTLTLTQPLGTVGATFTNTSGSVAASGAGLVRATGGSTFTQANASTTGTAVEILNSTLAFAPASTGSSRFTLHQTSSLSGNVPAGASVTIEAVACSYNTAVTAAGAFTNAGTIRLTATGCGGAYALLSGPGLLTNTGTIAVDAGTGGERYLRLDLRNQGLVQVDHPVAFDQALRTFTNEGTLRLTQAMSTANATVRNLAGSIDGTGAGQLTAAAGSTFQQGDGDTSGNPVVVLQSDLAFLAGSSGSSAFVAHQSVGLAGDLPVGAALTIEAVACSYNTSVTAAGAFTSAGSIRFTATGCGGAYALLAGSGLLTNTGSITVAPGTGGERYLRLPVRNLGSVTVDQPLAFDAGGGTAFTNEGTVTMTQPVTASGAAFRNLAGSIAGTGAGQLTLVSGSTFQQGDGGTAGNPVVLRQSDLEYLPSSSGTSAFVAHQSMGLAGDLPSTSSLTIEAVACSYNTLRRRSPTQGRSG